MRLNCFRSVLCKNIQKMQKERIDCVIQNLNPLLNLLKFTPVNITKVGNREQKMIIKILKIIVQMLFFSVFVILMITLNNAHKKYPKTKSDNVIEFLIFLVLLFSFSNVVNIAFATKWFYDNYINTFCASLANVGQKRLSNIYKFHRFDGKLLLRQKVT
jgi:hypothetical protein